LLLALYGVEHGAIWDARDHVFVQNLYAKIRDAVIRRDRASVISLTEGLDAQLERIYNDQTVADKKFEPLAVTFTKNKIVNDGLVRIAELTTNSLGINTGLAVSGSGYFTHFAIGTGTNAVSASDFGLQQEISRVSMATDGFMTAAGSIMRFGGYFSPSVQSAVITEGGVTDDPTAGFFLFRTVYPISQPLVHTVQQDFVSLSHAIYAQSV